MNIFRIVKEKREALRKERMYRALKKLDHAKEIAKERKAVAKEIAEIERIKKETRKLKGPSLVSRLAEQSKKAGLFSGKPSGPFAGSGEPGGFAAKMGGQESLVLQSGRNIWQEEKSTKTKKKR